MKSDEGNDSLDTIIRQAIGREPFLSFSRVGDSPIQWIQLLHALDQQDLPGWPLLSPLKVQMQKCDKCSREFYSPINHRRHLRVDHRKLDKDSPVTRDQLGLFWDKLPLNEAKKTMSFEEVKLEEIAGSSIIKSLTSIVRKPGFSSLPQACLRTLLDIVQGRFSQAVSSKELFSILDDASEKTFLCGNTTLLRKYIFDGGAGKIGLETKNVVACTSFLVEQKLVSKWLEDRNTKTRELADLWISELSNESPAKKKDKEAQDTSKKRQDAPEKKKQKKHMRKEQKAKAEVKESSVNMLKAVPPAETPSPLDVSDSVSPSPETQPDQVFASFEPVQLSNTDEDLDADFSSRSGCGHTEPLIRDNAERRTLHVRGRQHTAPQWQAPAKSRGVANVRFPGTHNSQASKLGAMQKEQKAKAEVKERSLDMLKAVPRAETSSPLDSVSHSPGTRLDQVFASFEPIQLSNTDEDLDAEAPSGFGSGYAEPGITSNVKRRTLLAPGRRHIRASRWHAPMRLQQGVANVGFHGTQNSQASKVGAMQKPGTNRESRAAPAVNGNKVWSPKAKPDFEGESSKTRGQKETTNLPEQNKVFVGTIPIALRDSGSQQKAYDLTGAQDDGLAEHQIPKKNNVQEKPIKHDSAQGGTHLSSGKHWKAVTVGRHETTGPMPLQSDNRESKVGVIVGKGDGRESEGDKIVGQGDGGESEGDKIVGQGDGGESEGDKIVGQGDGRESEGDNIVGQGDGRESEGDKIIGQGVDQTKADECHLRSSNVDDDNGRVENTSNSLLEGSSGSSSSGLKAFLAQRWKEAIAADHVMLVLSPGCPDPSPESSSAGAVSLKYGKSEKGFKKYIPKKR